jgi:hypothetical protein
MYGVCVCFIINDNTLTLHVYIYKPQGTKYAYALKWGIYTVSWNWINACLENNGKLQICRIIDTSTHLLVYRLCT